MMREVRRGRRAVLAVTVTVGIVMTSLTAAVVATRLLGPDRYRSYVDEQLQLVISYPTSWHAKSATDLLPGLEDPRPLVSIATFEPAGASRKCGIYPLDSLQQVGDHDALVIVYERRNYPVGSFRSRPRTIARRHGRTNDTSASCPGAPLLHSFVEFEQDRRGIQLYIGTGPRLSASEERRLWKVVNGLRFT